jgi:NO-binding membrane sensor protein with MHYT domain
MAEIHHFTHGWVTPTLGYALSVLGSLLGLTCAVRFREAPSTPWRLWWLGLAAIAIGGTGIWTMHFVAMLGFSVVGETIRYDVLLTAVSAVIAFVTVAGGFAIALLGTGMRTVRIIIGGVVAGLGVAAMHYTGMAAMRMAGDISYGVTRVIESVAIAVVAATVALRLALTVTRPAAIAAAALIMGVAVNGMHFTGMSAMLVHEHGATGTPAGASAGSLLIPIGLAVVFAVLGLVYALMAAPTEADRAGAAYLAARMAGNEASRAERNPAPRSGAQPGFAQSGPSQSGPPQQQGPPPQRPRSGISNSSWTFRDRTPR